MQEGIPVVLYETGGFGEESVVPADADIVAGKPVGTALAEEDVAGDDVLVWWNDLLALQQVYSRVFGGRIAVEGTMRWK